MSFERVVEFYCAIGAIVFAWLEPKFTFLTVAIILTMRYLFGATDDTTLATLMGAHVVYFTLALLSIYANCVLAPRQKINNSILCG